MTDNNEPPHISLMFEETVFTISYFGGNKLAAEEHDTKATGMKVPGKIVTVKSAILGKDRYYFISWM